MFKFKGEPTTKVISNKFEMNNSEFPDLHATTNRTKGKNSKNSCNNDSNNSNNSCNNKQYNTIISTSTNTVVSNEKQHVLPGWTQYVVHKDKKVYPFTITYGAKPKSDINFIEKEKYLDLDSVSNIVTTLKGNWERYKINYDRVHGKGAYDLEYYTDPIYPSQEYTSDSESDYNDNDNNTDGYDSYYD